MDWEPVDESPPPPVRAMHVLPYAAPEPEESGKRVARALVWVAVLACIAVAVAIAVPGRRLEAPRGAAARTDITALEMAIDTFYFDAGRLPTAQEGLGALVNLPIGVRGWNGPYVKRYPVDPWGNLYLYRTGTSGGTSIYRIDCAGPDGRTGTADDITSGWNNAPANN
jgi:general secretion pathway protein G